MRTIHSPRTRRGAFAVSCALLAVLAAASCPSPTPEQAPAPAARDPEADLDDVIAAHKMLIGAYERGDTETFVGLLEPTSRLVIFHPFLQNRFDGIDAAREGAPAMFQRLEGARWTDVHPALAIEGDVAWLTGQVLVEAPGRDRPFVGRGTEIWVRRDTGWRLVHGHWSTNPEIFASH